MVELIPEKTVRLFLDNFNRLADCDGILPTKLLGTLLRREQHIYWIIIVFLSELLERIPQKRSCKISLM